MKKITLLCFVTLVTMAAQAQSIRAIFFNPPTATDDGSEYVEISHTPSTALTGLTLVEIDGDVPGLLNSAISLNSYSTGSNGLLLIRDASTVLSPAPSAETNVVVFNFSPDLQNGTGTFLIVSGYSGTVGTDYDSDNDGNLNSTPWTSVIDAIAVTDGTAAADKMYADDYGGVNLPDISAFAADGVSKQNGTWYAFDLDGTSTNPGPYTTSAVWDATGTRNSTLESVTLTPGVTSNPLPVKIKRFDVQHRSTANILTFSTATELNNDHFVIERSADSRNWTEIGQVKGAGTSHTEQNYQFTDERPLEGINYYRLRQVDFDGKFEFSPVRSVFFGTTNVLSLSPSPVSDQLTIRLGNSYDDDAVVEVISSTGQIVRSEILPAETTQYHIDMTTLPKGVYVVRLTAPGQAPLTKKFQVDGL